MQSLQQCGRTSKNLGENKNRHRQVHWMLETGDEGRPEDSLNVFNNFFEAVKWLGCGVGAKSHTTSACASWIGTSTVHSYSDGLDTPQLALLVPIIAPGGIRALFRWVIGATKCGLLENVIAHLKCSTYLRHRFPTQSVGR